MHNEWILYDDVGSPNSQIPPVSLSCLSCTGDKEQKKLNAKQQYFTLLLKRKLSATTYVNILKREI